MHKYILTTPMTTQPQAQHNLNTVVGLDMKMTIHPHPPHKLNGSLQEPQINIYWPQLNIMWTNNHGHNNNVHDNNNIYTISIFLPCVSFQKNQDQSGENNMGLFSSYHCKIPHICREILAPEIVFPENLIFSWLLYCCASPLPGPWIICDACLSVQYITGKSKK